MLLLIKQKTKAITHIMLFKMYEVLIRSFTTLLHNQCKGFITHLVTIKFKGQ